MAALPPDIPKQTTEFETRVAFLDYHRELLIDKAGGLTDEQLHTPHPPSSLTLGGLLNHMAFVEDDWFTGDFAGEALPEPWASAPWADDRDWEFSSAGDLGYEQLVERYRGAIARSRAVLADVADLSETARRSPPDGVPWSMRWILIHMIEETARHCGHADMIRESIDGSVGDFGD